MPRIPAFAVTAAAFTSVLAAAGVPAPLYVVYQQQFGIPDAGLTAAFAIYIVPIATALLLCGRLSDHVGRRPIAVLSPLLGVAACLVLMNVHGLGTLLLGRGLQGVATGLGTSALGTFLLDLHPPGRLTLAAAVTSVGPMSGVATGAVLSGALVQYGPHPTTLVYVLFAAVLAACAIGVAFAPETSPRLPGALRSLRPALRLPASVRPIFLATTGCFVACWSLGGFYQALSPSLTAHELGHSDHLVGGLAVASLIGTSGLGGPLTARLRPRTAMLGGVTVLTLGTLAILGVLAVRSTPGFFAASVVTGLGLGAAFLGGMRTLVGQTAPVDRAGVLSAAYLAAYLGSATPSFLAGVLVPFWGLRTVAGALGALVVGLSLLAIAITLLRVRPAQRD
ncbi:MFS transporter [Pseudonocardia acaciae]|uniref:MFS transporter n=1 Tax=Pseudonocardia acaciae TaxID=551276 RepID=UPI000683EF13|nr:MFS transporter [Pseudonocardia acaciae]